jgi:hypothetical protein
MTAVVRRLVFTAHVTSSAGWVGAVLVFLALAVVGLTSQHEPTVRGAYLIMAPAAWFVLVPLAHASLLSGLAISLGTPWGLFRHYWVASKLVITLCATVILLIYMGTFRQMAGVAADPVVELRLVRNPSPMVHAILALILLLAATVLGIYKPFGMTRVRQAQVRRAPGGARQSVGRFEAGRHTGVGVFRVDRCCRSLPALHGRTSDGGAIRRALTVGATRQQVAHLYRWLGRSGATEASRKSTARRVSLSPVALRARCVSTAPPKSVADACVAAHHCRA